MVMNSLPRWLWLAAWLSAIQADAQTTIQWNSDPNQVNLTSSNGLLDGGFNFAIGVFADGFVPTAANIAHWQEYWHPASSTPYDASTRCFNGYFDPPDNNPPFTLGTRAYVWGARTDATGSEWILFRNSSSPSWTWTNAYSYPPALNPAWNPKDATAVWGAIHSSGAPFLMQTAAVTSWSQWQSTYLSSVPLLDKPDDDPDHDGVPNLLEFVLGTPPLTSQTPVVMPVTVVAGGHLQITIPRRLDHLAVLTVEVSDNLSNWHSGTGYTAVVQDDLAALVVRDDWNVPHAKLFMRLKAGLPTPPPQ